MIHTIRAGDNDDEINIETDSTVYYVYGEEGNDTISLTGSDGGSAFFLEVLGGDGNDTIEVSGETNYRNGGDVVLIGSIYGGYGNDLIDISSTSVSPTGSVLRGSGNDEGLFGNEGDDTIIGSSSNDGFISGGRGNDILDGGLGDDILYGDSGPNEDRNIKNNAFHKPLLMEPKWSFFKNN